MENMGIDELNKDKLWAIVSDLRPFELVKIKKDENGKPGKIIVLTECVTILESDLTK